MTDFLVQQGDVVSVPSDLLLLKHAQGFYGADEEIARLLTAAGLCTRDELRPDPNESVVVETNGALPSRRVMFLGTPPLRSFDYYQMYSFAERAIGEIAALGLPVRIVTTTVHGTGYGLDGGESLQRLVLGFRKGLSKNPDLRIEKIIFLALEERAARMLTTALSALHRRDEIKQNPVASPRPVQPVAEDPTHAHQAAQTVPARLAPGSGVGSAKKRVFVAMPFSEEFQNVYEFGIYPAVRNCGFICERVDETHFTGDILGRIREGIESASLVVADLTEGRPNVYLEVGYAWGRGVPVIFVARKGEELHFDVSTHRCIFYGRFTQFAKELEQLIRGIQAFAPATRGRER